MKKITFILLLFLSSQTVISQGLVHSDFATGFVKPVGFVCDPNGNFLVWEQGGKLWFVSKAGVKSPNPILDISPEVFNMAQLGMISVVLHPNYLQNGFIYLSYTVDLYWELMVNKNIFDPNIGDTGINGGPTCSFVRVTRYTLNNPNSTPTANLGSRFVMVSPTRFGAPVTTAFSHVGGGMAFGSDGTLMVAFGCGSRDSSNEDGDVGGGTWSDWQGAINSGIMTSADNIGTLRIFNVDNYSGKVLRIDPITGNGVPSNPYYNPSNQSSAQSRFWAYGFRNPFRITFLDDDSGSHHEMDGNPGRFLISEVGSNLFEELNILSGSKQFFGWPKYEGINHLHTWGGLATRVITDTIIKPLIEYRNTTARSVKNDGATINVSGLPVVSGSSNVGGFRYSKDDLPLKYKNDIFFADYESRNIYHLDMDSVLNVKEVGLFYQVESRLGYIDINPHLDGIFYISGCGEATGKLGRIVWEDNSVRINAKIEMSHNSGFSPNLVNFNSEATSYNGSGGLTYLWDFGDGTTSTEKNISHVFTDENIHSYKVKLKVMNNTPIISYDSSIFYLNTISPKILSTSLDNLTSIPENADTTLHLSFSSDVSISAPFIEWRLAFCHNGHEHLHAVKHGNNQNIDIPATICDQGAATYWYKVYLEIKNTLGQSTVKAQNLYLRCLSGTNQTIVFNPIPDQNFGITQLPLNATASSGLNVEYFVLKGNANIIGNSLVFNSGALGEIKLLALQNGGSGYKQALPVEQSFKIMKNPCGEYFSVSTVADEYQFKGYNSGKISTKIFNSPAMNSKNSFSLKTFELLPGFETKPVTGFIQFSAKECP